MRIMLVTQEEAVYIPGFIVGLEAKYIKDITGITILPGAMAVGNVGKMIHIFGGNEVVRQGFRYFGARCLDLIFPGGKNGHFFSVKNLARTFHIPVYRPGSVNSPEYRRLVREARIDLVVSIASPQIFGKELLAIPPRGCINIHNALLPFYRGIMPSFWVLANGEEYTGVTVHYMIEQVDAGAIIVQEKVKIVPEDSLHSLMLRTKTKIGPAVLIQALRMIEDGTVRPVPMGPGKGSYCSFPDRDAVARFRKLGRRFR
jgi:methionyl-tRNA formyltransferase